MSVYSIIKRVPIAALVLACGGTACAVKEADDGMEGLGDAGMAAGTTSGSATGSTGDDEEPSECRDLGESCVAAACCAGLECVAGRVCGTEGSVASTGWSMATDDGSSDDAGSDDGADTGGSTSGAGMCQQEFSDCSAIPCCPGLECHNGDLGMTCGPAGGGGGDGVPTTSAGDGPATSGGGDGDGGGGTGGGDS